MKPMCTSAEQLSSLYCACCECYSQCGMGTTQWALCKFNGTCNHAHGSSHDKEPAHA